MDGDYYHDQEPHNMDERMMGFRPNPIGQFGQGRVP